MSQACTQSPLLHTSFDSHAGEQTSASAPELASIERPESRPASPRPGTFVSSPLAQPIAKIAMNAAKNGVIEGRGRVG